MILFGCVFTPDNEHMYSEKDFTQEFARGRPLCIIICKRPVPLDDHLQPRKGHEKCIFETLHNEVKCVLSIKESKLIAKKKVKIFTFGYGQGRGG